MKIRLACLAAVSMAVAALPGATERFDYGEFMRDQLFWVSISFFGFDRPLDDFAMTQVNRAQGQTAADIVLTESRELSFRLLTRNAAQGAGPVAFYKPRNSISSEPTHILICTRTGRNVSGTRTTNASLQTLELASGELKTVVYGLSNCGGLAVTPWGTVLIAETAHDGGVYELLDPLVDDSLYLIGRSDPTPEAEIVDSNGSRANDRMIKRSTLGRLPWTSLSVRHDGVVYFSGSPADAPPHTDHRGAIFKFVPDILRSALGPVSSLEQSPLAGGKTFALRAKCSHRPAEDTNRCVTGTATWVPIVSLSLLTNTYLAGFDAAYDAGASLYDRPAGVTIDTAYVGPGTRFCWSDGGVAESAKFGAVYCAVDTKPDSIATAPDGVVVTRFRDGDSALNSVAGLTVQPGYGNLFVREDAKFADLWACLPDGRDGGSTSDGCWRLLALKDRHASLSGFAFSPDGKSAILSVESRVDPEDEDLKGTDDLILITGFKPLDDGT